MLIKNTQTQYGIVNKFLHWLMALIIIGMLALGLYMSDLPISELKLRLYGIHKEFGILILMLVMFRIVWRIGNIVPLLPPTIPAWQKFAAHAVHWMLYGFMFAMPITGWLMTSAAGLPPSFFGLFTLPSLIAPNDALFKLFIEIHTWLAYGLIATFGAHVGAALKHQFINKDDVLRRML
ncbi:MAG TPA: cytochrome b [Gammaproteobacteria bacterium]|nr:cytochrome b [Gammaproteobacteria bacterium]